FKKNKKKTAQPGSPKSNSPIKQPKTATNRPQPQSVVTPRTQTGQTSVLNSPRNSETSSPQNQPELVIAPPGYEPSHHGYPPSIMSGGEPPTLTGGVMNVCTVSNRIHQSVESLDPKPTERAEELLQYSLGF
ncbi:hypothetical protein AC249_AIPGENE26653, partial [Exaiptasia diaphana]